MSEIDIAVIKNNLSTKLTLHSKTINILIWAIDSTTCQLQEILKTLSVLQSHNTDNEMPGLFNNNVRPSDNKQKGMMDLDCLWNKWHINIFANYPKTIVKKIYEKSLKCLRLEFVYGDQWTAIETRWTLGFDAEWYMINPPIEPANINATFRAWKYWNCFWSCGTKLLFNFETKYILLYSWNNKRLIIENNIWLILIFSKSSNCR